MRKILMDCDTGHDDACAITLAIASKNLELLGVTAVMGNLPLEQTYRNARELIGFLGADVPVLKGAAEPLLRQYWVGSEEDRGLDFPGNEHVLSPEQPLDAVAFLEKTLRESDGPVTLVPLAPLTNIAKLMLFYPDLVEEKVDEIVLMGGGYAYGNSTGAAELNIYADPEAAQRVFSFGKKVVMCGLDVCHNAYITEKENNERFGAIGNKYAQVFAGITGESFRFMREHPEFAAMEFRRGAIIYDTVPVIYLLHPEIFKTMPAAIAVECSSELCDGMTVCNTSSWNNDPKPHTLVLDVDREAYIAAVEEVLAAAEG